MGGRGYVGNHVGHYCAISSWEQYLASGGPRTGATVLNSVPLGMTYDGVCFLNGFFCTTAGGCYYANDRGRYCAYTSWQLFVASGSPGASTIRVSNIPSSMSFDGNCRIPQGFFCYSQGCYYANDEGRFCSFNSWVDYVNSGGPSYDAVLKLPNIPNSMTYDEDCL